ncbi:unnamed protein product [Mytilus coruscus]|uniref:Thyroglobulin type-1 domain-containing protein n=1 Tax=Mytilus coruscus TaxID=42192 RepID=A0A6J8CHB1_MYTCO|nr:unnamed protein product [Mytilus coruscus]
MAKSCCNRNGNACLPKTVFDETQAYEPLILENLEISSGSYDTLQNIQHSDFFYKNTPSRKGDQGDCKMELNQTYERLTSERDLNQHIYDSTHQDPECMSGNHLNSMPTSGVCYSQYTNSEKKRAEVKQDVYYSELQTQISCSCDLYEIADGKSMNLTHCSIPSKHLTSSYKKQTPFKSQRGKYYACFVFGFLLVGFIAGVTVFLLLKNNSQDLHKKNIQTPVDLITTEASTTRKMTSCQQLRSSTKDFSSDFYIPECTKTGEFEKRQCEGKVGSKTCWCVDPNGREIPGSQMTEPEVPDCHEGRNLKPCVFELLKSSSGLLGARQARCTFDGEYEEIQCHVEECWCVDKNGIERMGTRVFMTTWKESLVCEGIIKMIKLSLFESIYDTKVSFPDIVK